MMMHSARGAADSTDEAKFVINQMNFRARILDFSLIEKKRILHEATMTPLHRSESLAELNNTSEESARIMSMTIFEYGVVLAECYIHAKSVDMMMADYCFDRAAVSPLVAKLGFNYRMQMTDDTVRVSYYCSFEEQARINH